MTPRVRKGTWDPVSGGGMFLAGGEVKKSFSPLGRREKKRAAGNLLPVEHEAVS